MEDELEALRRRTRRRVITSGVAAAIVFCAALYLGRRRPPDPAPAIDVEMAQHHMGR